tara:strand:- start:160 stop:735 length:576 start_codon:yes stop_codon:yes gene_type:complete
MSRKLKIEDENPIDNLIYEIVESLDPIFYRLNFTPNIITTLSLLTGLLSGYYFYKNNYICIPLYIISYILDCSDGYFARKYKMTSKFGDYYDHISDTIKNVLIIYIIYMKAKPKYKNEIFLLILLFIILSFYHMSLQELVYNKKEDSSSLNILNDHVDLDKNNIYWSRYFGGGTVTLIIVIMIYLSIKGGI